MHCDGGWGCFDLRDKVLRLHGPNLFKFMEPCGKALFVILEGVYFQVVMRFFFQQVISIIIGDY